MRRMPRRVTTAHSKRAGVVIPLIHVDGVPSVLLEKRATNLRAHPDEVCLPGGMVCEASDKTIVETCLREMKEEIGGFEFDYHHETGGSHGVSVLGILRCNWGEGASPVKTS
jgi:8-oxo-dGTP pyrophosphatase MutT (NUDIX family)